MERETGIRTCERRRVHGCSEGGSRNGLRRESRTLKGLGKTEVSLKDGETKAGGSRSRL